MDAPPASAPLLLTRSEIVVHGLADGIGIYVLASCLWSEEDWPSKLIQASLVLPVILLSVVVMIRRFRPAWRSRGTARSSSLPGGSGM
ncbi:MAG: hypothetical protein WAM82_25225 [Thermoanaerobaculia bacterium]